LSIILGGLLALLFTIYFGSSINVSASVSTAPDFLIGNLSFNNITTSQVIDNADKITNYTKNIVQESKGNLTQMNILLINDLEDRSIINENDKQELLLLNDALGKIIFPNNFTLIDTAVSSQLEELATNSSNPMVVTLKSDLKKKIHDIGTDFGTLIAGNLTGNLTGNLAGNVTGGNTGLPPMTIGSFWDDEHRSLRLTLGCQAVGTVAMGPGIGSYIGSICGVILV
jgi:hypothetical protein